MMTPAMLTGKTDAHLIAFDERHRLHPNAAAAFLALQEAAAADGFQLRPASTFRDFERQRLIWNDKFSGARVVLDRDSRPLDILTLDAGERCEAILHWSAMPGASRHHWGSDLDVYDPTLLPAGERLRLEPWEYEDGGYFASLSRWLDGHMRRFDFYRPYARDRGGVAEEPWHISYFPLASRAAERLTPQIVMAAWRDEDIAGRDWLIANLPRLFQRFILNIDEVTP